MTSLALDTLADTQALAARLAPLLRAGDTLFLRGDLGTGKTTFAQALIHMLSSDAVEVTSPTFTLVQSYPVMLPDGPSTAHHYDLYRIEEPSALIELGLEEADDGLRLIEWPQRLPASFHSDSWIGLHFTLESTRRRVAITSGGALASRLGVAA